MSDSALTGFEQSRTLLRRAMTLGSGRGPIEIPAWLESGDDRADRLALVAMLGARTRFDRIAPPDDLSAGDFQHAPERLLGSAARVLLCRYARFPDRGSVTARLRILDTLHARGRHVHPFDYGDVEKILRADTSKLDANARLWLDLDESGAATPDDPVSADNWTDYPPAERVKFIQRTRQGDPAAARALVAEAIGNDAASVRVKLIDALAVGLGPGDVPFLRELDNDRAATVKLAARSLLARIDGTAERAELLASAHEHLELSSAGIIGRRKVLSPRWPKGLAKGKVRDWIRSTFTGVMPAAIAERLRLKPGAFADALTNETLREQFFVNALSDGDATFVAAIGATLSVDEAFSFLTSRQRLLASLDAGRQALFWNSVGAALAKAALHDAAGFLDHAYRALRAPPPVELMNTLLNGKPWKSWVKQCQDPAFDDGATLEVLVAVASPVQRRGLAERASELPPVVAARSLLLAAFLDAVDTE